MTDRHAAKKDIEIDLGDYEKRLGRDSGAAAAPEVTPDRPQAELSWGGRMLKRILLWGNVFFMISGIVIFSMGAYVHQSAASNVYPALATTSMLVGIMMVIVGGMGLCGSAWENRALLGTYMMVIGLFVVLLFGAAVAVLASKNSESDLLYSGWVIIANGGRVALQQDYSCCGLYAWNDTYAGQPCPSNMTTNGNPCMPALVSAMAGSFSSIGTFGLIVSIIMLGLSIVSYFLIRNISKAVAFSKSTGDAVMLMNITQ